MLINEENSQLRVDHVRFYIVDLVVPQRNGSKCGRVNI
jgi:hypothetical protein